MKTGIFNLSLKGQQSANMQKSSVVVVADKTSLKRPFVFANAVHMVGKACSSCNLTTRPVCCDANIHSKISFQPHISPQCSLYTK